MIARAMRLAALIGAVLLSGLLLAASASAQATQDKVVLDNDSIQIWFLTFSPGEVSPMHANAEPEIGIVMEGELTLITPGGREILKSGDVRWLDPYTPHEARNEGTVPVKMWALTLKKSKKGAAAP
jgi:quercetin dioxygenase-like cupin family protein